MNAGTLSAWTCNNDGIRMMASCDKIDDEQLTDCGRVYKETGYVICISSQQNSSQE